MKKKTYTRRPGESSVYSLSIVFDDPPAPAARDEFGRGDTCEFPARRLQHPNNKHRVQSSFMCKQSTLIYTHRIWVWVPPEDLATAEAAERLPGERGESESDYHDNCSLVTSSCLRWDSTDHESSKWRYVFAGNVCVSDRETFSLLVYNSFCIESSSLF